jgi:hypothetical protein
LTSATKEAEAFELGARLLHEDATNRMGQEIGEHGALKGAGL